MTLFNVLCDSKWGKSAMIGVLVMTFSQLTGMNAIMFYGTKIFTDGEGGMSIFLAAFIINGWNFLATFISMGLLGFVGRRPSMLVAQFLCTFGMFFMFFFTEIKKN